MCDGPAKASPKYKYELEGARDLAEKSPPRNTLEYLKDCHCLERRYREDNNIYELSIFFYPANLIPFRLPLQHATTDNAIDHGPTLGPKVR